MELSHVQTESPHAWFYVTLSLKRKDEEHNRKDKTVTMRSIGDEYSPKKHEREM